jgi:hypothetical protein
MMSAIAACTRIGRSERTIQLRGGHVGHPVAERFDVDVLRQAIRDALQLVAGYTYVGFCKTISGAGCAGYFVSFPDKRILYFGQTSEPHTEFFPGSK